MRYRPPDMVVKDISQHYHQWGARRFWFTDAQFITGKEAYPQCTEILERILAEKLEIEWSGYISTSLITPELAKLMVRSGVGDLGSRHHLGLARGAEQPAHGIQARTALRWLPLSGGSRIQGQGHSQLLSEQPERNGRKSCSKAWSPTRKSPSILGEERVFPLMFFLGIQPNTDLEQRLLEEGYLSAGYNPLMLTPTSIRKLLYNPAPLN